MPLLLLQQLVLLLEGFGLWLLALAAIFALSVVALLVTGRLQLDSITLKVPFLNLGLKGGSAKGKKTRRVAGGLPEVKAGPVPLMNKQFMGREELLEECHSLLQAKKATQPAVVALHGLGGVGKSQAATQYAYTHGSSYRSLGWIRCEEATTRQQDFADFGRALHDEVLRREGADSASFLLPDPNNVEDVCRRTLAHLESTNGWLLVFDNAERLEDLKSFLPRQGAGSILITSRLAHWSSIGKGLKVQGFDEDEALSFLLGEGLWLRKQVKAARVLIQETEGLPLALAQAKAFMEGPPKKSIEYYLQRFRERKPEMLTLGTVDDYDETVATTWRISFEALQQRSSHGAALLKLCAFLAPEAIPLDLLREVGRFLPDCDDLDDLQLDVALQEACKLALLREDGAGRFSVHRLVQVATVQWAGDEKEEILAAGLRGFAAHFGFDEKEPDTWPKVRVWLPHAEVLLDYARGMEQRRPEEVEILHSCGWFLRNEGNLAQALAYAQSAADLTEAIHGSRTIEMSLAESHLQLTLKALGDLVQAKHHAESSLEIAIEAYGEHHPKVAIRANNLGLILKDLGDLEGARRELERALAIDQQVYGEHHPVVATCANNLGLILMDLGDLEGARRKLERALAIAQEVYGEHYPVVATAANNLGIILQDLGDLEGARREVERGLAITQEVYGEHHPVVATAANNLGIILQDLGDLEGARREVERALAIDQQVYGEHHPGVARDANNLGTILKALGDLEGARREVERALAIAEHVYGEHHPVVATDLNNLGLILKDLGDLEGGRREVGRALAIAQQVYGEHHPLVATCLHNLSGIVVELGQVGAAIEYVTKALQIRQATFGDEHHLTTSSREHLERLKRLEAPDES